MREVLKRCEIVRGRKGEIEPEIVEIQGERLRTAGRRKRSSVSGILEICEDGCRSDGYARKHRSLGRVGCNTPLTLDTYQEPRSPSGVDDR